MPCYGMLRLEGWRAWNGYSIRIIHFMRKGWDMVLRFYVGGQRIDEPLWNGSVSVKSSAEIKE